MSLYAVKYLPDHGWVGAKNFEFAFKPTIFIKKSFRKNVERIYIWENTVNYTEGINEYGIAIFSSNVTVKEDSREGRYQATEDQLERSKPRKYYSPNGLRIRRTLQAKSVNEAVQILLEQEITGCTVVFDRHTCVVVESGYIDNGAGGEEFVSETKIMNPNETVVRGKYGILLPWVGYSKEDSSQRDVRVASENQCSEVSTSLYTSSTPNQILSAISTPQILKSPIRGSKVALQAVLIPNECKIHIRNVWCRMRVNMERLNAVSGKTSYEISCAERLSFSEHMQINPSV